MIEERGTFHHYTDADRTGFLMRNEDGVDWHHYVLSRVIFNGVGSVTKLFEHGSMANEVVGDRYFANVEAGEVTFVSKGDPSRLEPRGALVVETDEPIVVGMLYDNGTFSLPKPSEDNQDIPGIGEYLAPISRKQFAYATAMLDIISGDEALAWATAGTLPAILEAAIENIPDGKSAWHARMHLAASTQFDRDHALTPMIAVLLSSDERQFDDAAIDEIWRLAATL